MEFLRKKLAEREVNGTLRTLKKNEGGMDFFSNDYLGAARNGNLAARTLQVLAEEGLDSQFGSTGSRLISGNLPLYEKVENYLACHFYAESSLVFGSGFAASLGLLSCIGSRNDTILYDELVHASARDGIRLSFSKSFSFKHNDLTDLETKLKKATGQVFVVTESLFSMDGDFCPLEELIRLKSKYDFVLILDEAHSAGIYGEKGRGVSAQFAQENEIIRIVTFGKAFGAEGAAVLGAEILRQCLINFSRPFIYSTAPAPHFFAAIQAAVEWNANADSEREMLMQNISTFNKIWSSGNNSPIQSIKNKDIESLREMAGRMIELGFLVKPIYSPTVPEGKERIRLVLHAFNTEDELLRLHEIVKSNML